MQRKVLDFVNRHTSIVLTTHEGPDADGIGAELLFAHILRTMNKTVRIINMSPMPDRFAFMDPQGTMEVWDAEKHGDIPGQSALIIVDTADEFNTGGMIHILPQFREVFVVDHHELARHSLLDGYIDPKASSTCEMIVELAESWGIGPDLYSARAAFAGISYDTGSFSYSKTSTRTLKAALILVEAGVVPYEIYGALNESASISALLLQKQVLSTLEIHAGGRVAVQILRKEDLESTGANFEDAESFINIPLKSKDILVSILVKEKSEGVIRCSLRSKGQVNVSKIAQHFSGGGHVMAAGFKSAWGITETLAQVLKKVETMLDKI
ncbi:MAG: bifunctional oligoribonuclease/PAP phosphatase NrnA [Treponema sp.]|jgi:phosphoesterase RecJ-like protein|nr:bifunctional oligoribonuclease/PAP phosphatase NrnA [Treponema sp.]